jgi:hypothetical protein
MIVAQIVTLSLLAIFLVCGFQAHWFDLVLGDTLAAPDLTAIIRACVSLAALLGWAMRNEFRSERRSG